MHILNSIACFKTAITIGRCFIIASSSCFILLACGAGPVNEPPGSGGALPTTPAPVNPVTPAPTAPAPMTPRPATPVPATPVPVTPVPVTPVPSTPAPSTPVPTTPAPATPAPATPMPVPVTPAPGPVEECGATVSLYPAKLRRLTREEYRWTILDIFGLEADRDKMSTWPAEPKVDGFENNVDGLPVAAAHVSAFHSLASYIAGEVKKESNWFRRYTNCSSYQASCENNLIDRLGLQLLRRTPDANTIESLKELFQVAENERLSFGDAAALLLEALLQHPSFIYRMELPGPQTAPTDIDEFELASRLSFLLWASAPDKELLDVAKANQLRNRLDEQTARMLADPRGQRGRRAFYQQWLQLGDVAGILGGKPALANALVEETLDFVEQLSWTQSAPIAQLMTSDYRRITPELGAHYGVPAGTPGIPSRPGLLGQAAVAITSGAGKEPSLVKRGLYVYRNFFCDDVPSPPNGVTDDLDPVGPGFSQVQSSHERIDSVACSACHRLFDAFAYPLEPFDGEGKVRLTDKFNNVLESSGQITHQGQQWAFDSVQDLSKLIAGSDRFRQCFARKLVQYSAGSAPDSSGDCDVRRIDQVAAGGSYKDYVDAILKSTWFGLKKAGGAKL